MNLPNQQKIFSQITPKLHNAIFRCVVCDETFNLNVEKMNIVVRALGIAPVKSDVPPVPGQGQTLAPLMEYAPVCQDCFEELQLTDTEPQIIVPNIVPPKDVAQAFKK